MPCASAPRRGASSSSALAPGFLPRCEGDGVGFETFHAVMPGLVPGLHVFFRDGKQSGGCRKELGPGGAASWGPWCDFGRLLVARPEPDGARTAAALRAGGHEVVLAPLLRIELLAF